MWYPAYPHVSFTAIIFPNKIFTYFYTEKQDCGKWQTGNAISAHKLAPMGGTWQRQDSYPNPQKCLARAVRDIRLTRMSLTVTFSSLLHTRHSFPLFT